MQVFHRLVKSNQVQYAAGKDLKACHRRLVIVEFPLTKQQLLVDGHNTGLLHDLWLKGGFESGALYSMLDEEQTYMAMMTTDAPYLKFKIPDGITLANMHDNLLEWILLWLGSL